MNRPRAAIDQQASSWLSHDPTLASLKLTATRLLALNQALNRCTLAPAVRARVQVLREREGVVLLGVQGAAAAAKLRQQAPSLAACLTQQGWKINEIRLKVQADAGLPSRLLSGSPEPPNKRVMSPTALKTLSEASVNLHSKALAQALKHLARPPRSAD